MHIDLDLIKILDAIDRNKSFEAAGREIHKVRSALTYTIRKYEEQLGIQIFDRSKQRAEFTKAGKLLLEQGRELLLISNQITNNIKQIETGWEKEICIAYDELLNIQPILDLAKNFTKSCPGVDLKLIAERISGCMDALLNNRADIVIGLTGFIPARSDFLFEKLGEIEFVFAVAPSHPLTKIKDPLSSEIVAKHTVIVATDSARKLPPQTTGLLPEQSRITFTNYHLKHLAQVQGLGVGFLPINLIKDDLKNKKLLVKKVEHAKPNVYCYLAWNKKNKGKAQQWILKQLRDKKFKESLLM